MCLIAFSWQPENAYPLLLAANRDEFHARAAAAMHWWDDEPDVLAGRDLQARGTWLGLNRRGRFAAVTNIRGEGQGKSAPLSRGDLTRDYLVGGDAPDVYLRRIRERIGDYQGFNLLVGDGDSLWYLHGQPGTHPQMLSPGTYGLSNSQLDAPWPKVQRARRQLDALLCAHQPDAPTLEALRGPVSRRQVESDAALAAAGLTEELARPLSSQFIVSESYGTRCCTTLRWANDGTVDIAEQRFTAKGCPDGVSEFTFRVEKP